MGAGAAPCGAWPLRNPTALRTPTQAAIAAAQKRQGPLFCFFKLRIPSPGCLCESSSGRHIRKDARWGSRARTPSTLGTPRPVRVQKGPAGRQGKLDGAHREAQKCRGRSRRESDRVVQTVSFRPCRSLKPDPTESQLLVGLVPGASSSRNGSQQEVGWRRPLLARDCSKLEDGSILGEQSGVSRLEGLPCASKVGLDPGGLEPLTGPSSLLQYLVP
jgi:hypothetical protein